jgi:hypothetical protein
MKGVKILVRKKRYREALLFLIAEQNTLSSQGVQIFVVCKDLTCGLNRTYWLLLERHSQEKTQELTRFEEYFGPLYYEVVPK